MAAFVPFLIAMWIVATTASFDAQVAIGIPALVALAAGVRMAMARARSTRAASGSG